LSARAAWRLASLGFTQVYRYTAGKKDWFASGLKREGKQAEIPHTGELSRRQVPTCRLNDRIGDVHKRAQSAGWDLVVVVNDEHVVFGLLREETMADDPNAAAEQLMEAGPATVRPSWTFEETTEYLHRNKLERILVTTSDGRLVGLFEQEEAQRQMERLRK
jgi:predicted transcriptional regulator